MLLIFATASASLIAKEKTVIEKRDDLPRHTYTINVKAVELYQNRTALLELASKVKADLEEDLDSYIINDKTTLKEFYAILSTVALLEGRWSDYLDHLQKRRELEDKEANRLTMGMIGEAIAEGKRAGVPNLAVYVGEALKEKVASMPYQVVETQLKSAKGSSEILSSALLLGQIESTIQPMLDQSGGKMSRDVATSLISTGYTLEYYLPLKDEIARVLTDIIDANRVEKKDIWAARKIALHS